MKYTLPLILLTAVSSHGAVLSINMTNNFDAFNVSNPFNDEFGNFLANGDLVQLGYFELGDAPASNGDSFDNFVAIDTVSFSVGVDGKFSDTANLDDAVDLPGTGSLTVRFGLRIFNAPNENGATRFNTVTHPDWDFTFLPPSNPPPPAQEILLDPVGGVQNPIWQDAANPFSTSLESVPIPEASTSLASLLGLVLLAGRRRRK